MFAPKTTGAAPGGLMVNTNTANSLFGGTNTQAASATTPAATGTSGATGGGLFGNLGGSTKPSGGLFGNTTTQQPSSTGTNMFSGLGGQQQSSTTTGGGLFGSATPAASQPQSTGLFGGATAGGNTTQSGTTGGGLFGNLGGASAAQTQNKTPFGGLGASTTTTQNQTPTLSLFGNKPTGIQQPQQQPAAASTVVPGVKIDLSNLLPTTKFESCADEIKDSIERMDAFILNQIKMCNEITYLFPTLESEWSTIPNDVEFVQGKLDTIQHALENDASDIDQLRNLVARDAAEAQVAFRSIDTLKLPMQYQTAGGAGWWSAQDQKLPDRQSLRSTRKNTLALPDEVEGDPSTATSINGIPVNLVDYFSQRSDEMGSVLDRYKRNLKDIEDHLHNVELTLSRQINEFVASRNREGAAGGGGTPISALNDLAAVLGDVESGILGVASRLGSVKEQVQEVVLGPPSMGDSRF
ncbi:hypothetical protein ASPZODRAFT_134382 [Penicilliopsis zonata CBS 506.65]|uniref:Nucleoporin NUP49/NSP49 n=1 Tax=Penicilliopsis zonata CBS 506.65 TaxID=1073090 RepID=A0A1L9SCQ5_9EURO|nr:hypothetical protein ASPZODRAFT_134382 [Penicilliopsis zonata CBS 506.65]OJJ44961.1 hypothetical protein ASPZODRAFT_134382 [Penicilliopsis zonata CBS 506.65]